jgi:hypothetical protein
MGHFVIVWAIEHYREAGMLPNGTALGAGREHITVEIVRDAGSA